MERKIHHLTEWPLKPNINIFNELYSSASLSSFVPTDNGIFTRYVSEVHWKKLLKFQLISASFQKESNSILQNLAAKPMQFFNEKLKLQTQAIF